MPSLNYIPSTSYILNDKLVLVEDIQENKGRNVSREEGEEVGRKAQTLHYLQPPLSPLLPHKHCKTKENSLASGQIWAESFSLRKISLWCQGLACVSGCTCPGDYNSFLHPSAVTFTVMWSLRWQHISMDELFHVSVIVPARYLVLCMFASLENFRSPTLVVFSTQTIPVRGHSLS